MNVFETQTWELVHIQYTATFLKVFSRIPHLSSHHIPAARKGFVIDSQNHWLTCHLNSQGKSPTVTTVLEHYSLFLSNEDESKIFTYFPLLEFALRPHWLWLMHSASISQSSIGWFMDCILFNSHAVTIIPINHIASFALITCCESVDKKNIEIYWLSCNQTNCQVHTRKKEQN